ncbi:GGDEF domain-containing protein [Inhella gelatinilytica]|uniref:diguanylate cyclase n=1 Tax=Inhella gelatinilytica TaxID=2795030 RepID=A0A931NED9_9BURK|nr:GGDEF domain-containing protein [Inhella gelatinilytica]MBH9553579.1 GGDEF domain-containing protein [Inhella gelatinilytica]
MSVHPSPSNDALPLAGMLGSERRLRIRMGQQVLSLALVFGNGLLLTYAAHLAGTPTWVTGLWFALAVGFQLMMALAVRLEWTAGRDDPSLAAVQIGVMVLLGAAAYPLAGPLRALAVPTLLITLAFGMFARCGQAMFRLTVLGLLLLLAVMGLDYWVWPGRSSPDENIGHALCALFTFPALGLLMHRMARLRDRQREQRQALNEALVRIKRLARRDDLTGLYNRRQGKRVMLEALQRQKRAPTGLLVVLLDLDHFKKINDTQGHAAGDAVLRCFAKALTQSLRKGDAAVRWGGEEFLAVLEPTAQEGLVAWLARLKLGIERQPLVTERPELRFTFSGGAAFWRHGESLEAWVDRADQALYRAKAEGRDRVLLE